MKKIISIFLCSILLAAAGCGRDIGERRSCDLYFLNSEKTAMVKETRNIPDNTKDELAFAVQGLIAGPSEIENVRTIPEGTELLSISVKDKIATVDFNNKFDEGTNIEKLWSRYTLVLTLCEFDGIEKVKIFTEGKELMGISSGEPLPALGKGDIVTDSSQIHNDKTTLTLYFGDSNVMYLVAESRQVEIKEGEKKEKVVVEELLKGPKNEKLIALFKPEVKVLSAETKEGVCFVNFSADLSSKLSGGSALELLLVYSVVNSLCELKDVDKVQFLIEGKKVESLSHMYMAEPFEPNPDLLKSNSKNTQ